MQRISGSFERLNIWNLFNDVSPAYDDKIQILLLFKMRKKRTKFISKFIKQF